MKAEGRTGGRNRCPTPLLPSSFCLLPLLRMRYVAGGRRELAGLDAVVLVLDPADVVGVTLHPERDGRAEALLVELCELHDHVLARVAAQVVQLAHVDAV